VYHFDLYRLRHTRDMESIGWEEYFGAEGVCVVEWPERAGALWPKGTYHVEIRADYNKGGHYRELTLYEDIGN
jgi:tRNA threonylcarbamoyladenosine biosynthesis protein TsaE